MPKIPVEKQRTLNQTTTFRLPPDFSVKKIAKQLKLSQGELVRRAIKDYALKHGITISN